MPRDDIQKLLGRYATNTLTEQERRELFEAALTDQALFNALTDEQALKELLDDPRSRRLLIEALQEKQPRRAWSHTLQAWLQQPSSWALVGGVAVALLALTFVVRLSDPLPQPQMTAESNTRVASPLTSPAVPRDPESGSDIHMKDDKAQDRPSTRKQERQDPVQMESPAKPEQKAPAAAKQVPSEAPVRESFSRSGEPKKSEADDTSANKAQAPQLKALGQAREEARRPAPLERAAKPTDAMGKAGPPMFRYTLMKKEVAGHYSEAQPTMIFRDGDQFRLAIEPDDSGYLYILAQDVAGNSKVIFPSEGPTASARVEKMVQYLIPPAGDFTFEQPGDLRLTMIFSREPLTDFRQFPESLLPAPKRDRTDVGAGAAGPQPSIIRREITLRHP